MFLILKFVDIFFKIKLFNNNKNHVYHKSVNQFGPGSSPDVLSGLIWVQTVCKGYQQMSLVGK